MRQALVAALILSVGIVPASVWAQSKDECEGKVMAAIKMLQIRSTITRTEQRHGDLSVADIDSSRRPREVAPRRLRSTSAPRTGPSQASSKAVGTRSRSV